MQIRNLMWYLDLELPHLQLPLLMELEEHSYMENYMQISKESPSLIIGRRLGLT
jgi:hypothetical protein